MYWCFGILRSHKILSYNFYFTCQNGLCVHPTFLLYFFYFISTTMPEMWFIDVFQFAPVFEVSLWVWVTLIAQNVPVWQFFFWMSFRFDREIQHPCQHGAFYFSQAGVFSNISIVFYLESLFMIWWLCRKSGWIIYILQHIIGTTQKDMPIDHQGYK